MPPDISDLYCSLWYPGIYIRGVEVEFLILPRAELKVRVSILLTLYPRSPRDQELQSDTCDPWKFSDAAGVKAVGVVADVKVAVSSVSEYSSSSNNNLIRL